MTLNQLRSFIAVARHNGFTAAARALRMSQTTITSQIQVLEEEHGVRLFERRGRRIELTQVGSELLQFARRMVDLEDDATMMLKDSAGLRSGELKIGAVSPYHVIEIVEAFNTRYPDVYLAMTFGNSEAVLHDLGSYGCDVGILARDTDDDRFHVQHYASYPVMAFVHRDHRLAGLRSIGLEALGREKLLMRERGSTTRRALEEGLVAIGLKPRVAMEIGSREAIREAVIRGLGVGTVSESEYVPDELLHPLPIIDAPVLTHIYVCCLRERRRSRMIAAFFEALQRTGPRKGMAISPKARTAKPAKRRQPPDEAGTD
ncbi:LysR family transcriptional regulator [Sandaracinobacter neustonicus]|uniref:LysR family transcriptional regulator n=1 Tax=Sandaracinobacter neustonicus TaxID=1715348 RepID=A0A501XMQ0_9SPHN|nr:LysR substrate-binding domain-containing protein [Sandaracinobacter neustonicus]TPE61554.1 LysR family transcriptional regulator [Sandaracinobacter neustonicus]